MLSNFGRLLLSVTLISCLGAACSSAVLADGSSSGAGIEKLIAELTDIETRAAKTIGNDKSTAAELEAVLPAIQRGLSRLSAPEGLRLANGDSTLQDLRPILLFRLAELQTRLGRKNEALNLLDSVLLELPGWLRHELLKGSSFASLGNDPEFERIKIRLERATALWDGSSFLSEFKENISEDEKIAGLSAFWSEVKNNFMNPSRLVEVDWDRLYLSYLPRVRQTKSTFEYYRVLQEMCARLQDGHTRIWMPMELHERQAIAGELETALVEDKVVLVAVNSEELRKQGLAPGQEIVSIDGIAVKKYAEEQVAPYQSASTPQDLAVWVYSYMLTLGAKGQAIRLEVRGFDGQTITASIPRTRNLAPGPSRPLIESRMLDGNIAYVAVNSMNDLKVVAEFAQALEGIGQRANALILDVRNNGGGNSGNGYEILNYLTDQPYLTSDWKTRSYSPTFRSWGKGLQWRIFPAGEITPKREKHFTKPVALLIGPRTYSAAEDFCVAFRNAKRGPIVGELSGGSTGNPLSIRLPGGGMAMICTKLDSYPDGTMFVGVGIKPDLTVSASVEDVRVGRDRALETAARALSERAGVMPDKN